MDGRTDVLEAIFGQEDSIHDLSPRWMEFPCLPQQRKDTGKPSLVIGRAARRRQTPTGTRAGEGKNTTDRPPLLFVGSHRKGWDQAGRCSPCFPGSVSGTPAAQTGSSVYGASPSTPSSPPITRTTTPRSPRHLLQAFPCRPSLYLLLLLLPLPLRRRPRRAIRRRLQHQPRPRPRTPA